MRKSCQKLLVCYNQKVLAFSKFMDFIAASIALTTLPIELVTYNIKWNITIMIKAKQL